MLTPTEYILQHLKNFNTLGHSQESFIDFSIINLDTIFWSLFSGIIVVFSLLVVANKMTAETPNRFQSLVEMLVEFIEKQSKHLIGQNNKTLVSSVALFIFCWVTLLNALDLIPVDWIYGVNTLLNHFLHIPHHRLVPTTDLNGTLGISLSVLVLMIFYNIKSKGILIFLGSLFFSPLGSKWYLAPFNFILNIVEFMAKAISLGMRLFGNMYAGELVFLLIALLGSIWHFGIDYSILGFFSHIIVGTIWAVFHILVIFLQAFIFMMLTLVYIGQAYHH